MLAPAEWIFCDQNKIQCLITKKAETAIDRVKFGSDIIDADVYINVQGDEPIVNIDDIKKIPRTASGIYSSPNTNKISFNEIQPGDLVFFKSGSKISHIGLISNVTDNEKDEKIFHMVHASSSSGIQDTEKTNYTKTGVNKNSYWSPKIAGYGRVA